MKTVGRSKIAKLAAAFAAAGLVLSPALAAGQAKKRAPAIALSFDPVSSFTPANADPRRPVIWSRIGPGVAKAAQLMDRRRGGSWDRLPYPLGLLTLLGLRHSLREQNLYDPGTSPPPSGPRRRTTCARKWPAR